MYVINSLTFEDIRFSRNVSRNNLLKFMAIWSELAEAIEKKFGRVENGQHAGCHLRFHWSVKIVNTSGNTDYTYTGFVLRLCSCEMAQVSGSIRNLLYLQSAEVESLASLSLPVIRKGKNGSNQILSIYIGINKEFGRKVILDDDEPIKISTAVKKIYKFLYPHFQIFER